MLATQQQKKAIRFVLLIVFSYSMSMGIIMPVLPNLIVELEGVSLSEAAFLGGIITSAYAACQMIFGPLVGNLSDRFGRRPVFLISLAGFSIDFVIMGFAPNVAWLIIGRSIAGGLGAIFGPATAVMSDISSGEERAKRFGLIGAAFGIGFIAGPALGGILADFGTRTPFFIAAGICSMAFFYGLFSFPETLAKQQRRPFSWSKANPIGAFYSLNKLPGIVPISFITLLWSTANFVYPVSWAFFTQIKYQWSSSMVGLSMATFGLSMVIVQFFFLGKLVNRYGERHTAFFGLFVAFLCMLIYAFTNKAEIAWALGFLMGFPGVILPCLNAMMSRRVSASCQGELQGFNSSLAALGSLIAPLAYNTSLSYFTSDASTIYFPGAPLLIAATITGTAMVCLIRLKPTAVKS